MKKAALSLVLISSLFAGSAAADQRPITNPVVADDVWSYSLALQAATWGGPLVTMYAFREHVALGPSAKAAPNTLWRMENISTPALSKEAGYVTPNVNVIYGFGFMDLRQEPILIEAPDSEGRYYMVEILDMWTNAFAYIGGRSTGYKGGKFLLTGPGWKGTVPEGVERIYCPTPWVLVQPRVHIYRNGELDLAGAQKVLQAVTITSFAKFMGRPQIPAPNYDYIVPKAVDSALPVSVMEYKDPLQFWELLAAALKENPPPKEQVSALLPLFKPLGIEPGKHWDRTKLSPGVLEAMKKAASEIGALLSHLSIGTYFQGASIPPATIGKFGTDYRTRAIIARVGLTANKPSEAVYWMYTQDKQGAPLTGEKKYTMTFKEGIPFEKPGFWSITLYDAVNNYTIVNPIHRYMLGSDTPDLKKNSDGSFTLYIQNTSPGKDKESNWLPAPTGTFYLVPRSYPPKPNVVHLLSDVKAWPIPVVEQVQ